MQKEIKEIKTTNPETGRIFEYAGYRMELANNYFVVFKEGDVIAKGDGNNLLIGNVLGKVEEMFVYLIEQLEQYKKGKVRLNEKGGFSRKQTLLSSKLKES